MDPPTSEVNPLFTFYHEPLPVTRQPAARWADEAEESEEDSTAYSVCNPTAWVEVLPRLRRRRAARLVAEEKAAYTVAMNPYEPLRFPVVRSLVQQPSRRQEGFTPH